jgi:hypothetical protein
MLIAFVCGPYRAPTHYGVLLHQQQAREAAALLWQAGFAVICPHMNSAWLAGAVSRETILRGYLEMIEVVDCVVTIGAWEQSEGAVAEVKRAEELGKVVFHDIQQACNWCKATAEP